MITVTCQYTGLNFEASSKRSKNHPPISALLNEAATDKHNPGGYAAAKAALAEGRQLGFSTIEEFVEYARAAVAGKKEEYLQAQQARREARAQREALNRRLRAHGYRWQKEAIGTEEDCAPGGYAAGIGELDYYKWRLYAPDSREVSVAQALAEIEPDKAAIRNAYRALVRIHQPDAGGEPSAFLRLHCADDEALKARDGWPHRI